MRVVGGVLRRLNEVVGDQEIEEVARGCWENGWSSLELVELPVMDRGRDEGDEVMVGEFEYRQVKGELQVIY